MKLCLLGTSIPVLQNMDMLFGQVYESKYVELGDKETYIAVNAFFPQIIIVFMENVTKRELLTVLDIKANQTLAQIPIVVVGSSSETALYHKVVGNDAALEIPRPVEDEDLFSRVYGQFGADEEREDLEMIKRHVLVVDDDPIVLKLIRQYLKDLYDVSLVKSGSAALDFLEKRRPDLILLDYLMPDMSGNEVLQEIRRNPRMADLPVVFLTGMTEKGKVMECLAGKPQGYLLKPVKQEMLLAEIAKLF